MSIQDGLNAAMGQGLAGVLGGQTAYQPSQPDPQEGCDRRETLSDLLAAIESEVETLTETAVRILVTVESQPQDSPTVDSQSAPPSPKDLLQRSRLIIHGLQDANRVLCGARERLAP